MAAAEAEGVAAQAWSAVNCLFSFCCTRGEYFSDLNHNLTSLVNLQYQLQDLKQEVEKQVAQEKNNNPLMQAAPKVNLWLRRVNEMEDSATEVLQEGNKELGEKWLRCLFPKSCCAFNEVGKRVSKKVTDVKDLIEKGSNLSPRVVRRPPSPVDEWQIGFSPVGLDTKLEEAWRYLGDPCAKIIGIHGPGGAGKTTLLK